MSNACDTGREPIEFNITSLRPGLRFSRHQAVISCRPHGSRRRTSACSASPPLALNGNPPAHLPMNAFGNIGMMVDSTDCSVQGSYYRLSARNLELIDPSHWPHAAKHHSTPHCTSCVMERPRQLANYSACKMPLFGQARTTRCILPGRTYSSTSSKVYLRLRQIQLFLSTSNRSNTFSF